MDSSKHFGLAETLDFQLLKGRLSAVPSLCKINLMAGLPCSEIFCWSVRAEWLLKLRF